VHAELKSAQLDRDTMKEQAHNLQIEYDRLATEFTKLDKVCLFNGRGSLRFLSYRRLLAQRRTTEAHAFSIWICCAQWSPIQVPHGYFR
jgi:hypothetical protein